MRRPLQLAAVAATCATLLLTGCATPSDGNPSPRPDDAPAAAVPAADEAPPAALGPVCTSPAGYSVARPAGWSVDDGNPGCSWFDPAPVTVPEGTDAVRTAVAIRVETGSAEAVWPDEVSRTTVEVDGRTAQRIEQVTTVGLYPAGTPITSYAVDLGDGRVLLADTVGLAAVDHERNVRALDEMMRSLELHGDAPV